MAGNRSLRLLDVSRNRLGADAASAWGQALATARYLTTLKMGWNSLGTPGALEVVEAVFHSWPSLEEEDDLPCSEGG